MSALLEACGIVKRFGGIEALSAISLTIARGVQNNPWKGVLLLALWAPANGIMVYLGYSQMPGISLALGLIVGGRRWIGRVAGLAEHFADRDKICVILGDNILEKSIADAVRAFEKQERGARILLKEVTDAERFGVAEMNGDRIVGIEEKPKKPKSNYAVTGIYMYDGTVFDKVKELVPSGRGELEITDVNNAYIREGTMTYSYVDGWWTDAGTFESLLRATNLVAQSAEPERRAKAAED